MPRRPGKSGRTVIPRGELIRELRLKKGWNVAQMAREVGYKPKTVLKVEASKPCYVFTLTAFADALDVSISKILQIGEEPYRTISMPEMIDVQVPIDPERRILVRLTVATPCPQLEQPNAFLTFFTTLQRLIASREPVVFKSLLPAATVVAAEKGDRAVVTLEISDCDALRLFASRIDGTLTALQIVRIDVEKLDWMDNMVASLRVLGTPIVPDPETWNEMKNLAMMDHLSDPPNPA